ncbi:MAG: hypothetical protein KGQ89_11315 [Verrucomicrobia bacterium]|nr:hypothetical protein [Verrucomicrobiota bacterium]
MAAEPQISEIERLIERAHASRLILTGRVATLRHRADIPARLRESFHSSPSLWFGGSLLIGWLFTVLVRGRRTAARPPTRQRKGVLAFALGTVAALAKPTLKTLLIAEVRKRILSPSAAAKTVDTSRPYSP